MIVYVIGVVFSAVGFYMLYDAYYFRKHARPYEGKIIGHKKRIQERYASGKVRYSYYPIIEYWDELKTRHEFISDMNMSKSSGNVGDRVEVLVLDGNHATARLKQLGRLVLAYAFAIVGPIVLLVGLVVLNKSFMTYFLLAIALIAALFYLTQVLVASSRKKKAINTFSLFEDDDTDTIHRSETPPTASENFDNPNAADQNTISQNPSYVRIVFASLFFILALSVLWFGLNQAFDVKEDDKNSLKADGIIIEDRVHREGGMDVHVAVVEYQPLNTDTVRVTLNKTIHPTFKVGDTVIVSYDQSDVTSAKLYAGEKVINSYMIFVLLIGGILLVIAFMTMPKRVH